MLVKKKVLIILLSSLFLLMIIQPSFAVNNETNQITMDDNVDKSGLTTNNDVCDISINDNTDESSLKTNSNADKLKSTNEYYYDASTTADGSGLENDPYKDFTKDNLKPVSINHLKNGEYHLLYSIESSDMTFIGEEASKTIIKCDCNSINVTKSLKLINITLYDFTIRNKGNIQAKNTIFDGGFGLKEDRYGNSYGGAIHTLYSSKIYKVNIDNCTFKDCIAEYGGAIYMDGGELNIKDSLFIDNLAYNYGGAIAAEYYSKLNINNTKFIHNKAFGDAGGAIYLKYSDLTANSLEFINSTASFGAAITALNAKLNLKKILAENNTATFEGGAIYQMYGELFMQNSRFINNVARNGGALFIDNLNYLKIPANTFEDNTAKIMAGAIYSLSSPKIGQQGMFINNKAPYYSNTYESQVYNISSIGANEHEIIINENPKFNNPLPTYYNLIDDGLVTPVKDQENGGNCWAFAAMASLESCILKATGKTYDLSEENMKNLIQLYSDYGLALDTNDGAYISTGLGYLVSWLGPVNETEDVYDDHTVLSPLMDSMTHIQNILLLTRTGYLDNDAIKEAILNYGAVGTGIGYDSKYFNNKTNAYYAVYAGLNHAVTIVGWNDTYSKTNFLNTPDGDGAWIVKNSWGEDWGDNGYFYVSYYDWNIAKMGLTGSSFTFILNETMKYDKNYQYDVCGKTSYSSANNDVMWYQNIFTATDNEALAAVSTYFEKETNWTLSVFVDDILKLTKTGKSNAGYYTINLDELIQLKKGNIFKILFQIEAGSRTVIPICEESGSNKFLSQKGLSYFSYDGEIWHDLYASLYPSVACIKAFTILNVDAVMDLKVTYTEYNPVEITTSLLDEYGRIIKDGEVTFKLEDTEINVPIINGQAQLTYNFTNSGINTIEAIFNSAYTISSKTCKVNIKKIPLNLTLNINQDKNNAEIILSLSKELNSKVKVLINDNEEIVDLINGQGNLKLKSLTNGDYNIKAILKDSLYEASKIDNFKVNYTEPIIPTPTPTNNTNTTNSTNTTNNSTLTNNTNTTNPENGSSNPTQQEGNNDSNSESGNTYDTNTQNDDSRKSSETKTETTTTQKTSNTNSNLNIQTKNKVVLYVKSVKTIRKSANKLVLTASLKINKKSKKGKTVTFIVNGKKFKVKTNKNGVAKLIIKKAVLKKILKKVKIGKKIKYQIQYRKTKVKKTMVVKK